jgi:CBS-domain-containing membrane protein
MKNGNEGTVREIMMGSPVTLKPDDSLQLASDLISLGRLRHVPIVENGKLLGIVSERDLMGRAAERILNLKNRSRAALLKSIMIKEIMQRRVVTVEPDTPISEAAHLMAERKIGCLPVLSDGTLIGLITTTDLLRYVEGLG